MKKIPLLLMIFCALAACGRKNPSVPPPPPKQALHFPPPILERRKIGETERHVYATMSLCQATVTQREAGLTGILFKHDFKVEPETLATNVYMKNGDVYRYACMPTHKAPGVLYYAIHEIKRAEGDAGPLFNNPKGAPVDAASPAPARP